ncbi:MAG: DUF4330 domain-containing protein [Defluviitaleaceae bacterium]|nr:DUF4330 domain-containing protein [Defluviitaleaceae bacterium]
MIIDKDAKVFGKINIIDLCIVFAVIGIAAFIFMQFRGGTPVVIAQPETREFTLSFFVEEVENFRVEGISIGDALFDDPRNLFLGNVTYLDVQDAIVWNADRYGNTVRSNKEGHSSLEITTRLSATPFEHGIQIAGNRYGIGHSLTVRVGRSFIFMRISGLSEVSS